MAAEDLRLAGRKMELLTASVDPHVCRTGHHIGIAGQAQAIDVEYAGLLLIGNSNVDVFKRDDIAQVLGCSIVCLAFWHQSSHGPRRVKAGVSGNGARPARLLGGSGSRSLAVA